MFQKKKNNIATISQLDSAPISTVLASDIVLKGDISGEQAIKIDGNIIGNVTVKNGIIVGDKADITGDLNSDNIIIYGTTTGNITCNELIIKSTGKVNGEIKTQDIEIEMGGKYNGKLDMQLNTSVVKKLEAK